MTLKLIQGFETCRDDTDFRGQGWMFGTTKIQQAFFPQSQTGTAGTGMKTPFYNSTSSATPTVTNGVSYFNTGIAVNSLWNAGTGFTFGGAMTFNQNTQISNFVPYLPSGVTTGIVYDVQHALYWAYDSMFNIWTSPDLVTWTKIANQPFAGGSYSYLTMEYLGSGVMLVRPAWSASQVADVIAYVSSDSGVTFTQVDFGTTTVSCIPALVAVSTGNATYPHAVFITSNVAGTTCAGVWVGNITQGIGSMTKVVSITTGTFVSMALSVLNGYVVASGPAGFYSALASSASLNTTGAWSTATSAITTLSHYQIGFVNNTWVVASSTNLQSFQSTGGVPPTGTVTWTAYTVTTGAANTNAANLISTASAVYALLVNSATTAAAAYVLKSTDGLTWTAVHRLTADTSAGVATAPSAAATNGFQSWTYTGTRYVIMAPKPSTTSTGYNCIYSTLDMENDWRTEFVPDNVELTAPAANYGPLSIWGATAVSSTALTVTAAASAQVSISAIASGIRTVTMNAGAAAATGSVNLPNNVPYHYYEIQAVKNTGAVNAFDVNLYVDEALVATKTAVQFAATTDTTGTTLLVLTLNTWGQITGWDDLYLTLNDGSGITGNQGIVNVAAIRPNVDATPLNWTPVNSAITQSNNLRQPAASSRSDRGLTSFNTGDISVVGTTDTLPSGFKPIAIQFEGYAARVGNFNSTSTLSIVSGGVESAAPPLLATSTTGTYESQVVEVNPNGNVAWTAATVGALQFKVTKN